MPLKRVNRTAPLPSTTGKRKAVQNTYQMLIFGGWEVARARYATEWLGIEQTAVRGQDKETADLRLDYRAVGNLQSLINDRKGLAQLRFRNAERRISEEGIPAHKSVEAFSAEVFA